MARQKYYLDKRGKYYRYKLNVESGVVATSERTFHTTGETSKAKAREFVDKLIEGRQLSQGGVATLPTTPTLNAFCETFFVWEKCEWIAHQHAHDRAFSKSVAASRRGHLTNHIQPRFGSDRLTSLKAVDIDSWLVGLKFSNQTKNHILYSFNIVLREAKRRGLLLANPIDDVVRDAPRHEARSVFTRDEIACMFPVRDLSRLGAIWGEPKWATYFLLLATSGLRGGEARALEWRHVVAELSGVLVVQAVKDDETIGSTKTGRERAVLLPKTTVDVLNWWKSQTPFRGSADFLFFGRLRGQALAPATRRTVTHHFAPALARAGVEVRGRTPHSFRHTYQTILSGALEPATLRKLTGHATEQMSDRYTHTALEDELRGLSGQRGVIEGALGGQ